MAQCPAPKGGCCLYAENAFDSSLRVTFVQDWPLSRPPPIPLRGTSPYSGGRIGLSTLALASCGSMSSTHSAPSKRGKGGAAGTKGGRLLSAGNTFGAHSFSNSITLAVVILSTISQTIANLFSISSLVKRSTIYPFSFNFPLRHSS